MKPCPDCGENVSAKATKCPHCSTRLRGKKVKCKTCKTVFFKDELFGSATTQYKGTTEHRRVPLDCPNCGDPDPTALPRVQFYIRGIGAFLILLLVLAQF